MNPTHRFCGARICKKGFKFVALIALMIAAVSWAVMSLWNWLLPVLFQAPHISFVQAMGLLLLCRLLLGHPFGRGCPGHHWTRHGGRHSREQMRKNWEQLPEAERAKLREQMSRRWRC
jgi:hypothetical protein